MSLKRIWTMLVVILLLLTMGQTLVFAQDAETCTDADGNVEECPPEEETESEEETLLERLRRILGEDLPENPPPTLTPTPTATSSEDAEADVKSTPTPNWPSSWATPTPWPTSTPWPTKTPTPTIDPNAWQGQYFNNGELRGNPVQTRRDSDIAFNWENGSPFPQVPVNGFSARWTKSFGMLEKGFNNMTISTDFGVRVYVNDALVVNHEGGPKNYSTSFWSDGDKMVRMRVEYRHDSGPARFTFRMNGAPIASAPFGRATVVNGTPALRDGPGQAYWSNGRVSIGQNLILTGHRNEAGNWVCVVTEDGTVGWVNTYYLQSSTVFGNLQVWPLFLGQGEPSANVRQDVEDGVKIRYGPGTFYQSFDTARAGERLILVGRNAENDWLLVRRYDGTLGWTEVANLVVDYRITDLPIRWLE